MEWTWLATFGIAEHLSQLTVDSFDQAFGVGLKHIFANHRVQRVAVKGLTYHFNYSTTRRILLHALTHVSICAISPNPTIKFGHVRGCQLFVASTMLAFRSDGGTISKWTRTRAIGISRGFF